MNSEDDTKNLILQDKGLFNKNIVKEMNESFIEYAMSVIVSRALPDVRDGLKPVHRRIIYSMNESGFYATKPHKKSARIVGDVLGKYHPHGDTAVYDALVRMAQEFTMRYPLIDGHGNFGSIDGDSAAAMRYTEARLTKIAHLLINDIDKKTIDFVDNYDASELEPVVLPAKIPNLLINGSEGIAVGMATKIPPHNIIEVIDALILLARNKESSISDIFQILKGPDFPTGGTIVGNEGIFKAYSTGNGTIVIRANGTIESNPKTGTSRLIYTEIPFLLKKTNLIQKIADLVKKGIINEISQLRDESNRKGIRIVIDLKRNAIPEVVQNNLYKLSQLQTSFGINLIALVNNEPKNLNIKQILNHYLDFQVEILRRKSEFELAKSKARILILQGLKIALDNIDEVINIVRSKSSESDAQKALMQKFNLQEVQAKAITEMRLNRLTGLAKEKMQNEINELEKIINKLINILNNHDVMIDEIVKDLENTRSQFGDKRKTIIIEGESSKINDEDLIPVNDIIITVSQKGYVKRLLLEDYHTQRRGGVGSKTGSIYKDDKVVNVLVTKTHTDLLIFTSYAKVYRIRSHKVPSTSKAAKGIPFIQLIPIEKNEKIITIKTFENYNDEKKFLLTITKNGIVKKTFLSEYKNINRNGKKALSLRDGDELFSVIKTTNEKDLIIGSSFGRVVHFSASDVRPTGRTSSGVKGINLGNLKNNYVVGACSVEKDQLLFSIGQFGFGKMTSVENYRKTKRGAKGVLTINTKKSGLLVSIQAVFGHEELFVLTTEGIGIRLSLKNVAQSSRNTKGVKIIRLKEKHKITSLAVIDAEKINQDLKEKITDLEKNQKN